MSQPLRHNLDYLWPSEIASQFFCDYKVHLARIHPEVRISLPTLERGEASHQAIMAETEPISPAQIDQAIKEGKKLAICEWTLEGTFRDVLIRGRPDFFAFDGKEALLLLELKFSRGREPFRDQIVQAQIYSLLAESMGFSTNQLYYGIVILPPWGLQIGMEQAVSMKSASLERFQADGTLPKIYSCCEAARREVLAKDLKRTIVREGTWSAFLYRHDREEIEDNLSWAIDYWSGDREPVPVGEAPWDRWKNKCSACPYNAAKLCEHSLQPPDVQFEVNERDGLVLVSRQRAKVEKPS